MTGPSDSDAVRIYPVTGVSVLVTGSSRSLGLRIARAFAVAGGTVSMTAVLEEELFEATGIVRDS